MRGQEFVPDFGQPAVDPMRLKRRLLLTASVVALLLSFDSAGPVAAQRLPSGANVTYGNVGIAQPNASTLNINQSSNQAIINWNSFSVGRGGTVNFNQPGASSSTLNRVTGSASSSIYGTINAPGTVLLVNPNGIAIGKSGVVNTGSFLSSSLGISDDDYKAGRYNFSGNGASARVVNNGRINVSDGGFAALLGGEVANNGVIVAHLGKVALGSGEQATIDLSGDGFLSVAVPTEELGNLNDETGRPLVSNKGKIIANGGSVYLSAATAANILRDAVNVPGTISARSVAGHDGAIYIGGGPGGEVTVTGRLSVNGGRHHRGGAIRIAGAATKLKGRITANGSSGGTISVITADDLADSGTLEAEGRSGAGGEIDFTAADVTLTGAILNASGTTGGGNINIGGGPHASVALADAQNVSIDAASVIRADATNVGNGGHIVVWSDNQTNAYGTFSAQGGANGGNGGSIETSGESLDVTGISVHASATSGQDGNWLLDPTDLVIDAALANEIDTTLNNGTGVTLQTSATGSPATPYSLTAGEMKASGTGSIDVNTALSWTTSAALTLSAYDNIVVTKSITSTGGGAITLAADNTGTGTGTVSFSGGAKVATSGGSGPKTVTIFYNPTGSSTAINATKYAAASQTNYSTDITKGTLTSYMLVNTAYDLQNMQNNLSGIYALGRNINASVTSAWSGNFVPIGLTSYFSGKFNGQGYTISNLTINQPTVDGVGLFGAIYGSGTVVQDVGIVGGTITGLTDVGGLVGNLYNGTITQSYSGAAVTSTQGTGADPSGGAAGGLVGNSSGNISQSFATGSVTGYNDATIGGLVGESSGSITDSYATGAVAQLNHNGGNPNGRASIGGLVGLQEGTIARTYATGAVSGSNPSDAGNQDLGANIGGLVGTDYGSQNSISNSTFDKQTSGTTTGVGYSFSNSVSGELTSALQGGLPSTWSSSVWSIIAGQTFPYFNWQSVISGTVYTTFGGSTAASGITVSDIVNGVAGSSTVTTNASGAYVFFLNGGGLAANSQLVVYTSSGATFDENVGGSDISGLNIYGTYLTEDASSSSTKLSTVANDLSTAVGTNTLPSTANTLINIANTNFTIDQAVNTSTLILNSAGNVTQSAAINAANLNLFGIGGNYTLTDTSNSVDTLTASTGTVNLLDNTSLTVGTGGVNGSGAVTLAANGNLTIASSAGVTSTGSGDNIVLSATNNFINNDGASAVSAGFGGRWLIYSNTPTSDTFGNLNSGNTAIWGTSYPTAVTASGDRYVFAVKPTLTITTTSVPNKTYGADDTAVVATAYSASSNVSDFLSGVSNAFSGGSVSSVNVTSSGEGAAATVAAPGPTYAITASGAIGTWLGNYTVSYDNVGTLKVIPADVVVTAQGGSSTYGSSPTNPGLFAVGLENGQTVDVLTGLSNSFGITNATGVAGNPYALTVAGLLTNPNYDLVGTVNGSWTINPANIVVTALGGSSTYGSSPANPGLSATGLQNGQSVNVLSGLSNSFGITSATGVVGNPYTLTVAGALTNPNYTVTRTVNGSWTINPASLTITADDQSKVYGAAVPTLTASYSGLVNGDTASSLTTGPILSTAATAGSSVAGGPYGIMASGAVDSNYTINYVGGLLTVTPASLTISADNQSKVYGAALPTLTASYSGLVNGDTASSLTTGPILSTTATAGSSVAGGPYGIVASGAVDSNYTINYVGGLLTVTPASLTISADNQSKVYGAAVPTLTASYSGLVNGDTASSLTTGPILSTAATAGSSVAGGPYGIVASGAVDSNYAINYVGGLLTVTPASLTITANNQNMIYGSAGNSLTQGIAEVGLVNGDAITGETLKTNAARSSTSGLWDAGDWTITASNANGIVLSNYTITYKTGTLDIDPATLVLSAQSGSKTYDGTTGSGLVPTVTGLVSGDGVLNLSQSYNSSNVLTANLLSVNSGYTVRDGNGGRNYVGDLHTASGSITPASVELNGAKTYDSSTAFTAEDFGADGTILSGIGFQTLTVTGAGSVGSPNVIAGTQTLNGGTLALANGNGPFGGLASNYTFSVKGSTGTITPATLSLAGSKVYNGNAEFTAADFGTDGTINTGINNETLNVTGSGFVLSSNVSAGTQFLIPAGLALANGGGLASNYRISLLGNTGVITPATLTYVAAANGMIYGGTVPGLSGTVTGFVNGQTLSSATTGTLGFNTQANALTDVGSYAINGSGLTADHGNYVFQQAAANSTAFTITPAMLTYVATANGMTYGGTVPGLSGSVTGFVNGQDLNTATTGTLAFNTQADGQTDVGSYAITGSGLTADHGDYVFQQAAANSTAFTIGKASLTVTIANDSQTYGSPANLANDLGTTISTGVNGQNLDIAYSSAGDTTSASVANYAINGIASNGTGLLSNYAVTLDPGTLTVNPASLTITASSQSKIYGTTGSLGTTDYSESGLITANGDSVGGVTLTSAGSAAGATVAGGPYAIVASNALGSGLGNYTINYVDGRLTVDPASLTITASSQSKTYGATGSLGSTDYSEKGLVTANGDSIGAVTLTSAGSAASAGVAGGPYAIVASNALGSGLGNYTINYVNGQLTVNPASLTVTADDGEKTFGQTRGFTGTEFTSTGLQNGETIGLVTLSSLGAGATAAVGSFAITASDAAGGTFNPSNYIITYDPGTLTVQSAPSGLSTSRFTAPQNNTAQALVTISFQPNSANTPLIGVIRNVNTAANNTFASNTHRPGTTDVSQNIEPAGGRNSLLWSVSEFDKTQYTPGALPPYAPQAGQATVLAVIARAEADNRHVPKIDLFWHGDHSDWGALHAPTVKFVKFTDGQGAARQPGGDNGFVFVNGKTDLVALLKHGPVMLGAAGTFVVPVGPANVAVTPKLIPQTTPKPAPLTTQTVASQTPPKPLPQTPPKPAPAAPQTTASLTPPATGSKTPVQGQGDKKPSVAVGVSREWLLALEIRADGKSILADDPITGQQVVLAFDPAHHTVGAVIGIIDPKTMKLQPLGAQVPAFVGSNIKVPPAAWTALKAFTPASYFAVSM